MGLSHRLQVGDVRLGGLSLSILTGRRPTRIQRGGQRGGNNGCGLNNRHDPWNG